MELTTDTHKLVLNNEHKFKLTVLDAQQTEDSWLESKSGESFDRSLDVKIINNVLRVFFENKDIGGINIHDTQSISKLSNFIHQWNLKVGPTDTLTIKTVEMLSHKEDLQTTHRLEFRVFTYNCAGILNEISQYPHTWEVFLHQIKDIDVVVFGFQETDSLTNYRASASTLSLCSSQAKRGLRDSHTLVSSTQLLGLMTLVFLKNSIVPESNNLKTSQTSTGFMGIWANKGATLTEFSLFYNDVLGGGLDLKIVNCHLSAGDGEAQVKRRRWELKEIGKKFKVNGLVLNEDSSSSDEDDTLSTSDAPTTSDVANGGNAANKLVILLGDLNYRIAMEEEEVKTSIKNKQFAKLITHDGLTIDKDINGIFTGFVEPVIGFNPTYKYTPHTNEYRDRVPSYTDRILVKSTLPLQFKSYEDCDLKLSDHKPVVMDMQMDVTNCLDKEKYLEINENALRLKDEAENNSRPKFKISEPQIDVEGPPLSFKTVYIKIINTGTRPVDWVVTPPPSSSPVVDAGATGVGTGTLAAGTLGNVPEQINQQKEITNGIAVTPNLGLVDRKEPEMTVRLTIAIGVHPRDTILVFETRDTYGDKKSVHQYLSVHIEPYKSYLGTSLQTMPQKDGVPIPIKQCVDYLWTRETQFKFEMVAQYEPQLYQQILKWIDENKDFDTEVLNAADQALPNASVLTIAKLLLDFYLCSPDLFMTSNGEPHINVEILRYTCEFIEHFTKLDTSALDVWCECLYDHLDTKAGHKEKLGYLKSMLLAYN